MTQQEIASFYLEKMPSTNGRYFWQTMAKDRMAVLITEWLDSPNVEERTKGKLRKIQL